MSSVCWDAKPESKENDEKLVSRLENSETFDNEPVLALSVTGGLR